MSATATDTLTVEVNRQGLHSLEVPQSFEASESFTITLRNHGEAVHVHLHLDDALSSVASVDAVNHHLRAGASRTVRVAVDDSVQRVRGKLKIVTAYGAETRFVDVAIEAGEGRSGPIEIDESLAKPQPRERRSRPRSRSRPVPGTGSSEASLLALADPPLVVVGIAALVLAGVVIGTLDGIAVVVGVALVVVAALAVGYLLVQE